jgi:hypothetical protein
MRHFNSKSLEADLPRSCSEIYQQVAQVAI